MCYDGDEGSLVINNNDNIDNTGKDINCNNDSESNEYRSVSR